MHALLTDRYELAMLGAYLREGIAERRAVFELSVRRLPPHRRFLLVAGVDRAVRYLRDLRFTEAEVAYLRRAPGLADVMTDAMAGYLLGVPVSGRCRRHPRGGGGLRVRAHRAHRGHRWPRASCWRPSSSG
jgi:nicotinate phosphoribosyltransferase